MVTRTLALAALLLALALPRAAVAGAPDGWFGFSMAVEIGGTATAPRVESAWIVSVVPGSPADRQRVAAGETVLEIAGSPVAGAAPDDLKAKIRKPIGGRLQLKLQRSGGERRTVDLVAVARPDDAPK